MLLLCEEEVPLTPHCVLSFAMNCRRSESGSSAGLLARTDSSFSLEKSPLLTSNSNLMLRKILVVDKVQNDVVDGDFSVSLCSLFFCEFFVRLLAACMFFSWMENLRWLKNTAAG